MEDKQKHAHVLEVQRMDIPKPRVVTSVKCEPEDYPRIEKYLISAYDIRPDRGRDTSYMLVHLYMDDEGIARKQYII